MATAFISSSPRQAGAMDAAKELRPPRRRRIQTKMGMVKLAYMLPLFWCHEIASFSISPSHVLREFRMAKNGFGRCSSRRAFCKNAVMELEKESNCEISRRDVMFAGAAIVSLLTFPKTSSADMTLETFKRAYYRYVPRIESGRARVFSLVRIFCN